VSGVKFADLFAGIGGMRIAFEKSRAHCRLTSEIDEKAALTYQANFAESSNHRFIPDVREVARIAELGELDPELNLVLAGFPCQPFSIAGLRKGLSDERGKIFTSILDVLSQRTIEAFVLENVRGILSHDRGATFSYMLQQLEKCGFSQPKFCVMNSMTHGGVPQNRERVFVVGFRNAKKSDAFEFPAPIKLRKSLDDILEVNRVDERFYYDKRFGCYQHLRAAVTKKNTAYQWRRVYVRENKSGVVPALTANMGSGGHNVPIVKDRYGIRKLTPRECARLQGFPEGFEFPKGMADSHLYHQFGNSVTVSLVARLAKRVVDCL
jgi:DNA (cytosine-5)-methyltransferase 1